MIIRRDHFDFLKFLGVNTNILTDMECNNLLPTIKEALLDITDKILSLSNATPDERERTMLYTKVIILRKLREMSKFKKSIEVDEGELEALEIELEKLNKKRGEITK